VARNQPKPADPQRTGLNPRDEAARCTPGSGEDICPDCRGTGRRDNKACASCGGTGRIVEGIGGA